MKTNHFLLVAGVSLALALTFSCSSDSSDDPPPTLAQSSSSSSGGVVTKAKIDGVSQKGPFAAGSTVVLYELTDDLTQTGKSFNSRISDSKGSFEIKSVELISPYAVLKANGYYRNENRGSDANSGPIDLYAITDITDKSSVNVNILTHLEYDRVFNLTEKGMSVKDAKRQAQREILEVFYISGEFENSEDMSISGTSEGDAALLSISVLLQGDLEDGKLTERLLNFSQSIKAGNGTLNSEAVRTAMADWASDADLESIRDNIYGWRLSPSVPDFEKHIRNFVSVNYGLGPCDTEGKVKNNYNEASRNKSMVCRNGIWKVNESINVPSIPLWDLYEDIGGVKTGGGWFSFDDSNNGGNSNTDFVDCDQTDCLWQQRGGTVTFNFGNYDDANAAVAFSWLASGEFAPSVYGNNTGLCVEYSLSGTGNFYININSEDHFDYDNFRISLPKRESLGKAFFAFSDFGQQGWGTPGTLQEAKNYSSGISFQGFLKGSSTGNATLTLRSITWNSCN